MSEDKIEKVDELIEQFTQSQSDVQGQIVISYPQGVPISNSWRGKINPILIGALSSAVKLTFQNLCKNLRKGNLKRLYMTNEHGRAIIQNAGPKAILTTIADKEADLFRIAFRMSNLAIDLKEVLEDFDYNDVSDIKGGGLNG
ncbi:MAG: hypothetical protein R6U96_18975 [Promethearchaeia archaeon]